MSALSAVQVLDESQAEPVSSPQDRVRALIASGATIMKIAVEAKVKPDKLKSWLEGVEVNRIVEARILAWLDDLEQKGEADPEWCETPTASKIASVFDFARNTPSICIVYGGAGCGKTTTAQRYANLNRPSRRWIADDDDPSPRPTRREVVNRGAYYVLATRAARSMSAMLRKIAEAVGADLRTFGFRNDELERRILERIGPGDLLIIDEAQHLGIEALDCIRCFFDQARAGIVYLGNREVYSMVAKKNRRSEFAQLSSRIGWTVHVPNPDEGDIDAVLDAWGVGGRRERDFAQSLASGPGGLRVLANILRKAVIVARVMKRPLDHELLQNVSREDEVE